MPTFFECALEINEIPLGTFLSVVSVRE